MNRPRAAKPRPLVRVLLIIEIYGRLPVSKGEQSKKARCDAAKKSLDVDPKGVNLTAFRGIKASVTGDARGRLRVLKPARTRV